MQELLMALGLLLVLEGGLYALFPAQMKRAMLLVMEQPSEQLRTIGFDSQYQVPGLITY